MRITISMPDVDMLDATVAAGPAKPADAEADGVEETKFDARELALEIVSDAVGDARPDPALAALPRGELAARLPALPAVGAAQPCAGVRVRQLPVLEQRAAGPCGHHALHNLRCMLDLAAARRSADFAAAAARLRHRGAFWRAFDRHRRALRERAAYEGGSWPWVPEDIDAGDMERCYLEHLMRDDGDDSTAVVFFGYGYFQMTASQVERLQSQVNRFQRTGRLAFMLGVTNHWVSAVAQRAADGSVDIVYADSLNVNVFELDKPGMLAVIDEWQARRVARGREPYTDDERAMRLQSLRDQRDLVLRLARCLARETTVAAVHLEALVAHVLDSFHANVPEPHAIAAAGGSARDAAERAGCRWDFMRALDAKLAAGVPAGCDPYLVLVCVWLETRHRPQSLRGGALVGSIERFGAELLDPVTRVTLMSWAEALLDRAAAGPLRHPSMKCVAQVRRVLRDLLRCVG